MTRVLSVFCHALCGVLLLTIACAPSPAVASERHVAVVEMDMMIAPGAQAHLDESMQRAKEENAAAIVVLLDTPGGMLNTTQEMIQSVFKSEIPILFYVSPSGGTATSAGVFITLSGHVAAMAPGTSIGAATPIMGSGEDIQGDLKEKALKITMAMVRSIAEERGRDVEWAEKAVEEASSLTEREALEKGVIDFVAEDISDLLKKAAGKEVKLVHEMVTLEDFSDLPRVNYDLSFRNKAVNTLANPSVLAILWLAATTGISIELYNPGLIIPGLIGVICLIIALAMSSVIPVSQGAIILLVLGSVLIASDLFIGTGILGIGGIIAIIIGSIYLVDVSLAPDMSVDLFVILPFGLLAGLLLLWVVYAASKARAQRRITGNEGLVGLTGRALDNISTRGKIFVDGETWDAEPLQGIIEKDATVEVVGVKKGMILEIRKRSEKE